MLSRKFMVLFTSAVVVPSESFAQREITLDEPAAVIDDLSSINGIRELSNGSFLLSDGTGQALMKISLNQGGGGGIDTLGSVGPGPDEYRGPDVLAALPGDSTIMVDLGNGRLTVIAPNGEFTRTIPIAGERGGEFTMLFPRGTDRSGSFIFSRMVPGPTGAPESAHIVKWDPEAGSATTLGSVALPAMAVNRSGGSDARSEEISPVPMAPGDQWAVGPDGRVFVARWTDYHVEWIDSNGDVTIGQSMNPRPVPIRSGDKEAWIDGLSNALGVEVEEGPGGSRMSFSRGMRGNRPSASSFEWPENKPPFSRVVVDGEGFGWVERAVPFGGRSVYDVFDFSARHVATVSLRPGRTIVAVSGRRVYVDTEDEVGLRVLELFPRPQI